MSSTERGWKIYIYLDNLPQIFSLFCNDFFDFFPFLPFFCCLIKEKEYYDFRFKVILIFFPGQKQYINFHMSWPKRWNFRTRYNWNHKIPFPWLLVRLALSSCVLLLRLQAWAKRIKKEDQSFKEASKS